MNLGKRAAAILACLLVAAFGHGDHALLQDARGIFNVSVDATSTTWSRPLKVRYRPESFGYDFDADSVFPLKGYGEYRDIADVAPTTVTVGKREARAFMKQRGWNRYSPPPPVVITPPPPTPIPTPLPTPTPTPNPGEVASESLPIEDRIREQLAIFTREQTELAFDLKVRKSPETEGQKARLSLLERELDILRRYYPADQRLVVNAKEAIEDHLKKVTATGKFFFEE